MITTEELFAVQPAQQPRIVTRKCGNGWLAGLVNELVEPEFGLTEEEAIGRLHRMNQEILGSIRREDLQS